MKRFFSTTIFLLLLFTGAKTESRGGQTGDDDGDDVYEVVLNDVLVALNDAVNYVSQKYREVNLDAVLGLRMAEGQLSVLLERMETAETVPHIQEMTLERIRGLQEKMSFLCDITQPQLTKSDPEQLAYLGKIIRKGFWEIHSPSRAVDDDLILEPIVNGEFMNEDATDECVREILGTSADTKPCEVSDACVKLMTTPGYEMYTLSHQVFYLEIVQQEGCATQMVQRMKNDGVDIDPDIMMKTFCTNMLKDAEHIADGGFPSNKQDLFLEEALLCGLDGYREFYRPQWLDHILHWQDSSGCFKSSYTTDFAHQDTNDENKVKRREKILEDGCSSHKTAVAIGTLGGYVRYIMEAMI